MNIIIGRETLTKKPFEIDTTKHTFIQGGSGVGKSTLIGNICTQIIWNGGGLCLIDPHGDVADTIAEITDRVTRLRLKDGVWEYDSAGTLMEYDAITDLFSNVVEDSNEKFLIVDAARFGGEGKVELFPTNGDE